MTERSSASDNQPEKSVAEQRSLRVPTLRHLWLGLPVFLLVLKAFLFPLPLLDFWWHLKLGQIIYETHSIPRTDIFSFTAAGKPFIVQNWLAEVAYFLTYRQGGFPLLLLLNAALLAATLLFVHQLCLRASKHLWHGTFSAALVSVCLVCNLRPQVFSFLFFSVFYWSVSNYCLRRSDRLWILPLLMIVWVNSHGAFVLGIALMAIFFVAESIRKFFAIGQEDVLSDRKLAKLALALVLCILATLANPEGYSVYGYIGAVMGDPSSQQLVVEWQPPAVNTVQGAVLFYLPFFIATFALMLSDRRPRLTDLCLYGGFAVLGMSATRNSVWFLLVAAPILSRSMESIRWSSIPFLSSQGPTGKDDPSHIHACPSREIQYPVLNLAVALFALVLVGIQSPWIQARLHGEDALLDPMTPIAAMDYIEKHKIGGPIFHPQIYGDYLIWRLWPRQRTFFDGRVHVFGESLVRLYQQVYADSCWEALLKEQRVRYVLLSKQEEKPERRGFLDRVRRSPGWRVLFEDDRSALFENAGDI